MERGKRLHEAAAEFLTAARAAEGPPALPPAELAGIAEGLMELRRLGARSEVEWAFDRRWGLVEWFSREAWCRVKLDAFVPERALLTAYEAAPLIVDFKTGRRREEHREQLGLYAVAARAAVRAEQVRAELWYVDEPQGGPARAAFTSAEIGDARATWESRAAGMLADREFPATPGPHCRWCSFRRSAGGPCREG